MNYEGKIPEGEGWGKIGETGEWEIWLLENEQKPKEWLKVKVVLMKGKKRKANFRLTWSVSGGRFAKAHDAEILAEYYPDLAEAVTEIVKAAYGS